MRARSTVTAAATGVGLMTALLAGPAAAAPTDLADVLAGVSDTVAGQVVNERLEALQAIADANGGNRAMGTPGYEASGAYVERELRAAGYETERQYFDVESFEVSAYALTVPGVEPAPVGIPMTYTPSTPAGGVTGALVQPADADRQGCAPEAWNGVEVAGRVALVSRGTCSFGAKSAAAAAAGAAAVIIYNNTDGDLNGTLGAPSDELAPTVGVSLAEGQALAAAVAAGGVEATLDVQAQIETRETFNVLAETPWGRDDNVVMLGAHLDSVAEGPGINDNGTGSAAILETAVRLAEVGPLANKVRFAWWGAEELGLVGSTHYVDDLVANDPAELDRIATYLNFDMVGSPNYVIGVYDADQSTYEAPVVVPEGSEATEDVFTDYFDSIGQPWVDTEFSGRSDYQAFIENGIPASGLFTGADGIKTDEEAALFGGTAGLTYDPDYHSPADDITNVDITALGIMTKAIAFATASLAQDTSAVNGEQPPAGSVVVKDLAARSGCLDGRAYVAVHGVNGEPAPIRTTVTTPFGTASATVGAGRPAAALFDARAASVEAGAATVVASAAGDPTRSQTYELEYAAADCGG